MKLSISKNRVVFASVDITYDEVKKAEIFCPQACVLTDAKGNEVFRIRTGAQPKFDKYSLTVAQDTSWVKLYENNVTTEEVTAEYGNALVLANKTIEQIKAVVADAQQAMEGLVVVEE